MKAFCAATIFQVSDLSIAVPFYTEVLGFTKYFEFASVVGIQHGEVRIHLSGPEAQGHKKAIGEGDMYIFCDEVDDYFKAISAKGANTFAPPEDRGYGMRDFAVQDPDGNILAFGKNIEGEK